MTDTATTTTTPVSTGYAIIETGGKQYRVQEGTQFDVEKLNAEVDSEIKFDALLVGEGESSEPATLDIEAPSPYVTSSIRIEAQDTGGNFLLRWK